MTAVATATCDVVDGMPEEDYHSDPALSSSGANRLLAPGCPALFKWERDNGRANRPTFDFGHAAHLHVLGTGAPLALVDADDWRTKKAQEEKKAAYSSGKTPLLRDDYAKVLAMADAIREHPLASALFNPERGVPERSVFWHDERFGVDRRARFDWLRDADSDLPLIVDYKTTTSVHPDAIAKAVATYGYYQQHPWYVDAARAAGLEANFLFVFQDKSAPYLVTVVELHPDAVRAGRTRNDEALSLYADCVATDAWPSYTDGIELISLPRWAA